MRIELLNRKRWTTRLKLSMAMIDWFEAFHNRRRPHSSIGNGSPIEFEQRQQTQHAA
jgi:transposase InsO family protein